MRPCPKEAYADPLPPQFDPIFMKDAQCAESNEKITFRFLFIRVIVKIHRKTQPCMQNTQENIVKYVIDANLSRLGSTNSKKNISLEFFFSKMFIYLNKKNIFSTFFFFKSVQKYMKVAGCAETNERSIFLFLFFE